MAAPRRSTRPHWTERPGAKTAAWVLGTLVALGTLVGFGLQWVQAPDSGGSSAAPTEPEPPPESTPTSTAERLASVHVGAPSARIEEILGLPVNSRELDGGPGWTQQTYAADELSATTVTDESGSIVLLSIMSCTLGSDIEVTTPRGTTVVLQGPAIASAELASDGTVDDAANDRLLWYLDGGTGSSLGQLLEQSTMQPASGNGWKSYLVGINRACGSTTFTYTQTGTLQYFGTIADAPEDLESFRTSRAADFYTEILGDYSISEYTTITFSTPNGEVGEATAAPYIHDLPPEFLG
ncbi:hypothetical protein [Agromyces allii]|uniref:Uncharacterized protein n=1 Tax=Agromyces allii TaxID=393607 RepID=A0ABP5C3C9_9MICO|nr:hypothetical protein [Agromyces allii]